MVKIMEENKTLFGKVIELSDNDLTKVLGGTTKNTLFNQIEEVVEYIITDQLSIHILDCSCVKTRN